MAGRRRLSDAEKVAKILEKFNIQTDEPVEIPENNYNHTNAVAIFGKTPEHFVLGVCRGCNEPFAHNQPIPAGTRVGYCSDSCRKRAFEKDTGVKWESVVTSRHRDRWDGDPPMIITPEQLKNLQGIADWFTRNQTTLVIQNPEPEPLEELDGPEDYQLPTSPQEDTDSQSFFDEDSELTNLRQVEVQTNPLLLPDLSVSERTESADDPFGF